jgi:fermentation-respiration switch protein FrsA (DUF1100 family)
LRFAVISLLSVAIAAYAAVMLLVFLFQRSMLYYPDTLRPRLEDWRASDMEEVTLETEDGLSLNAWYRAAAAGKRTIVHFHGNAGHIGGRAIKLRQFRDAGLGLLLVEYRGYGGNPGKPSEEGLYRDARAALAFLTARGLRPADLVLYGESLGSGVVVELAEKEAAAGRPVGAVVLEAPYSSMVDAGAYHYPYLPARLLVRDRYASVEKIARVGCPVLILHGDQDQTVPIALGKRLFEAAREPKKGVWIPGAGHINLYDYGVGEAVLTFIGGN